MKYLLVAIVLFSTIVNAQDTTIYGRNAQIIAKMQTDSSIICTYLTQKVNYSDTSNVIATKKNIKDSSAVMRVLINASQVQADWSSSTAPSAILNKPTIITYTQGTGIGIATGIISNTAPDQIVSLTGTNSFLVSGTYPTFTLTQYLPTTGIVTRAINSTTFTPSSTKPAFICYNIRITCTATIGSASDGKVVLQHSINGGTTWIDDDEIENSSTVTLAVVLNAVTVQSGIIIATIPANALVRMNSISTGTTTISYIRGFEQF